MALNPSVRALQLALNSTGAKLRVDGIYGAKTHQALEDANRTVDSIFSDLAKRARKEYERYLAFKRIDKEWYTLAELSKMIARAETLTGVPADTLRFFITHEASQRRRGGRIEYDARSTAGRFRGLCQMSPESWSDAMVYARQHNINLMGFSEVFDPSENILACACYVLYNRSLVQNVDHFTPEIDYAMHNQGHTFVARVRRGSYHQIGVQSPDAVSTLKRAAEQLT